MTARLERYRAPMRRRPGLRKEGLAMGLTGFLHAMGRCLPFTGAVKRAAAWGKRLVYWRRLSAQRRRARRRSGDRKILVIMNAGIGNAVEATPLVQAIRAFWPRAHITICPPPGDLFDGWCAVNAARTPDEALANGAYDHTFVTWLSEVPKGRGPWTLGRMHRTECLLLRWFLKPEREYNLDMLRGLGYRGPTPPLYVSVRRPGIDIPHDGLRISLVPGAKPERWWRHKRWPYFVELAAALLSRYPRVQLCVLGGEGDDLSGELPAHPRLIDLRGSLSLRETAWVLRNSTLAIGNDCGPMHIADAVLCPSLVIFGPTCELKNGPRHRGVVLAAEVPCRPCQYSDRMETCEDARCMTDLRPELVLQKVAAMLRCLREGRPGNSEDTA